MLLKRLQRRFEVTEITFCLPFVQVAVRPVGVQQHGESPASAAPATERGQSPAAQRIALTVAPEEGDPEVIVRGGTLSSELAYRVATEMDYFGPVFRAGWRRLEGTLDLYPGDFVWLRLHCWNFGDRVLHNVQLAMEGLDLAKGHRGLVTKDLAGWPRHPVANAAVGQHLKHVNPGESYTLHCIVRVPLNLKEGARPRFQSVKPEFNILKQIDPAP
jgi:hypothetical protein